LVLTFLVLPFWYLLTRVDPDIFQTSSKMVVCVCIVCILAVNSAKDVEICKERESLESAKQSLDRRVVELEQELDIQRREITTGKVL